MSNKYNTTYIGDISNINANSYSSSENWEYVNYLDTGNITKNKIDEIQYIDLSVDKLPSRAKRKVIQNSIIYSTVRPNQQHFGFIDKQPENFLVSTGFAVIDVKPDTANPKFVYYYLTQDKITDGLHALAEQSVSAYPSIKPSDVGNVKIFLPDLPTQEKIAHVLSSLDDKIELNNKINQNLEQQADLLFNDLFLEDKDCIKLSEVISTTSGGTPSRKNLKFYTNGSFCWVKSKELNGTFITETEEKINQLAIEKSSAKLLPPYSVLLAMYGATVGEYAIISKQMTCNQAICAIIPNEKYPYTYIYEYIKLSKEKIKTLAIGSAQQNISQVLIKDLLVHKNINKIKEYHFKTRYLFELIKNNQIENEKLKQLRDTLLPKLMSGEIDVDKVEI